MEKQPSATIIAELVCTRISHDVIGNIGAVSNAVELLEEGDEEFLDDIKSILKTSSGVLSARLKFFRMAFGLNNANLDKIEMVKVICEDYLKTIGNQNYPIELSFNLQTAPFCKLAMVCVMIVADCFIRGGKITVSEENAQSLLINAVSPSPLSAEKIAALKAIADGAAIELNAQYAPLYYLLSILRPAGIGLEIDSSAGLALKIA